MVQERYDIISLIKFDPWYFSERARRYKTNQQAWVIWSPLHGLPEYCCQRVGCVGFCIWDFIPVSLPESLWVSWGVIWISSMNEWINKWIKQSLALLEFQKTIKIFPFSGLPTSCFPLRVASLSACNNPHVENFVVTIIKVILHHYEGLKLLS